VVLPAMQCVEGRDDLRRVGGLHGLVSRMVEAAGIQRRRSRKEKVVGLAGGAGDDMEEVQGGSGMNWYLTILMACFIIEMAVLGLLLLILWRLHKQIK
jgi:hypothetical protein